jgi:glucokinase
MFLAGDIGGTKTILALLTLEQGAYRPVREQVFPSTEYDSLEAVINDFLGRNVAQVRGAAFGVAGPVVGGRANITNLPWVIEESRLSAKLGRAPVALMNDLEAIANAVPQLRPDDAVALHAAAATPQGAIAVIAAGTGLGEAYLTYENGGYRAHPSEGGHASYAPQDDLGDDLLRYVRARFGHVSYERVCSGIGLPNVYGFVRDEVLRRETPEVAERLAGALDATPVIVAAGLDSHDPCLVARTALELFCDILAEEAGNLALKVLATGGVYIGGGLPPRLLPLLERRRFLQRFRAKGRFEPLLSKLPVKVIVNPKAALLGASTRALQHATA